MEEQKIELKIINMADIQSQEIEWLLDGKKAPWIICCQS